MANITDNNKLLAFIPARSGSKGLKDKNIKQFCGKPLMAYTIEAAKESGLFSEVFVSTDSEQYANIARQYGADVPFLRSEALASDTASTDDAIIEALEKFKERGKEFDVICILQPTSPLRTAEDIKNAYKTLVKKAKVGVVSVCEPDHSPLWCNTISSDGSMAGFLSRDLGQQRQELDKYYRINGAIYFVYRDAFDEDPFLYREGSYAYVMDRERSVDIDSELDFRMAEVLMCENVYSECGE